MGRTIIINYLGRKVFGHNTICSGPYKKSQILFLIDAIIINAAHVLTNGIFLSGFIISLNGSDFIVALLINSTIWASILSIFSFLVLEKIKQRKKFLIVISVVSRVLISATVFVPLILTNEKLIIFSVSTMVIISNILWGIYQLGWMIWYMEIAPKEKKNEYIYFRMFLIRIAFTITTLVMGYVLDYYNKSYKGFFIVFIIALILSVIDMVILIFIDEPEYKVPDKDKANRTIFFEPIKSLEYRKFLVFTFMFYSFLMIATSFTSIYLIRYLKFDYGFISSIQVISYIVMIFGIKIWGNIQRKYGTITVLKYSAFFIIADCLIYVFLIKETYFLLFLGCIIGGIGTGGFNIAIMAYRFELMPESAKSIYEGWFKAVYGVSVLIAPVIGERLMKIMPELRIFAFPIGKFQFLYLFSFITAGIVVMAQFSKKKSGNNKTIDSNVNSGTTKEA